MKNSFPNSHFHSPRSSPRPSFPRQSLGNNDRSTIQSNTTSLCTDRALPDTRQRHSSRRPPPQPKSGYRAAHHYPRIYHTRTPPSHGLRAFTSMTTPTSLNAQTEKLLLLLDIRLPILLSPMAGVSTPQLAAEVSNAGGLGSLGLGASSVEQCHKLITDLHQLTTQSFQLNFFAHTTETISPAAEKAWLNHLRPHFEALGKQTPSPLRSIYPSFLDSNDYLDDIILQHRPTAVSFHFGIPLPHQISSIKRAGIITMATATTLPEAQEIVRSGIDIVIAQGIEAGGHRGVFNKYSESGITTNNLVRVINDSFHQYDVDVPIVASGGIMNGHHAREMLALGAAGVQLGTAFLLCPSAGTGPSYRKALHAAVNPQCSSSDSDNAHDGMIDSNSHHHHTYRSTSATQITSVISGRPARGLINRWHHLVDTPHRPSEIAYPLMYDAGKQLQQAWEQHHNNPNNSLPKSSSSSSALSSTSSPPPALSIHPDQDSFGAFWAGTGVSLIRPSLSATQLMEVLSSEMGFKQ